jgi:hypothetical protein
MGSQFYLLYFMTCCPNGSDGKYWGRTVIIYYVCCHLVNLRLCSFSCYSNKCTLTSLLYFLIIVYYTIRFSDNVINHNTKQPFYLFTYRAIQFLVLNSPCNCRCINSIRETISKLLSPFWICFCCLLINRQFSIFMCFVQRRKIYLNCFVVLGVSMCILIY